jgi:hypothetical protein
MTKLWLIANRNSRTTDQSVIDSVKSAIEAAGGTISRTIDLAGEELPKIDGDAPDIIASLGGDGTANAVIDTYGNADAPPLLILPGGTMNLLAHRLHGESETDAIIAQALSHPEIRTLPLLEGPDFRSLVGIIAGPTAAWGTVREDIRRFAIGALIRDLPVAIRATYRAPRVQLKGDRTKCAALFIEPREDGLHAHDIQADSLGDLASHGWAWLNRDFLGGPTRQVGEGKQLTIKSRASRIALLVDGERQDAKAPLALRWRRCPARFIATSSVAKPIVQS